jgi:acetyltransferase
MTVRHLDRLFRPASVAVIGASERPHSVGAVLTANLRGGGFAGRIMPVNPKRRTIQGLQTWPDVLSLPEVPDLALICTPAATVPDLIRDLGRSGTRAAIVLTAGLGAEGPDGRTLQQAMLDAARPHLLRILGPNCVGALVPQIGLNASFAHTGASPGSIAFVSQSGALCTVVLDWARASGIGFSHFISLGDSADVDFGDVIDYLASDPNTDAILLYIESVKHARKFMSAARAAARNKPIIAVKSGRTAQAAHAAHSHTGALAGGDDVMSAALARAGIVRVDTPEELFAAAETLSRRPNLEGGRIAILTNGGGPGVLAVDAMAGGYARLADLAPATIEALDRVLPATWSRGNPVDIIGDAPAERYGAALGPLLADPDTDAVLVLHAPTAIVPSEEPARGIIEAAKDAKKPVFAAWLGAGAVTRARADLHGAGFPVFDSATGAVQALSHVLHHRRGQALLLQAPPASAVEVNPDLDAARAAIAGAMAEDRRILTEPEAKKVLAAYGIPVAATETVPADAEAAAAAGDRIGYPVALKILSRAISHKSDVGGVALDIESREKLADAAGAMLARVRSLAPGAQIDGFTVQTMVRRPGAYELIAGIAQDPIFGPVLLFGQGGVAVEVVRDRAVSLPPLNLSLAADLIGQTRIAALLRGFRDRPPVALRAIEETLVRLSQLLVDLPEVSELDINPLLADTNGVIALDARIAVAPSAAAGVSRLAISPYPQALEETTTLSDGREVLLRPIRPEDKEAHEAFFGRLEAEDVRFRFFTLLKRLPPSQMARLTQIDYDREMAFIATLPATGGASETLGVARLVCGPDRDRGEFGIIVRSDCKRLGLGRLLMDKLIRYARQTGTGQIVGAIMRSNRPMLRLAEDLGFHPTGRTEADVVEVSLDLERRA